MDAPICPYCKAALEKMPTRKTKCKVCGKFIYVKSTPDDRTKRLMTEAGAAKAEKQWLKWSERATLDRLSADLGLRKGLSAQRQADAIRALANDTSADLHRRKIAAFTIASKYCQTEMERCSWAVLGHRLELITIAQHSGQVQVQAGAGSCPSCRSLHGKRLGILEAMNSDLLPNLECESWKRGGGSCAFWAAVIPGVDSPR